MQIIFISLLEHSFCKIEMLMAFLSIFADLDKTREKIFFLIKKKYDDVILFALLNRSLPYFFSILTLCQRHLIFISSYWYWVHITLWTIIFLFLFKWVPSYHYGPKLRASSPRHVRSGDVYAQVRASVPKYIMNHCYSCHLFNYAPYIIMGKIVKQ